MELYCEVPPPIKFNCWKHHAFFIKQELEKIKSEAQIEALQAVLLKIGESQMDLYYGKLSPEEIANSIISFLPANSLNDKKEYIRWLHSDRKEHKNIKLKDTSFWTLRSGDEEKRFIHIHPGRYSPNTVRVKALTLKTTISVLAHSKSKTEPVFGVGFINKVREEYLNASPVKSINKEFGLGKLLNLFVSLT